MLIIQNAYFSIPVIIRLSSIVVIWLSGDMTRLGCAATRLDGAMTRLSTVMTRLGGVIARLSS